MSAKMSEGVKLRRTYDSSRRREQALETRRRVLEGARELFVEEGFVGATIEAIAARAEVSAETIYATFKNKRSILSEVIDISMAGDDAPVPILDRPWVQDMREAPDQRRRLEIMAKNGRSILERTAPIYEVMRGAASVDPEIRSLWELNKAQRFAGQGELLRILMARGGLRAGLTVNSAVDTLFAIGSPETYRLLVVDRRWSADRFERWYADTVARLLLG